MCVCVCVRACVSVCLTACLAGCLSGVVRCLNDSRAHGDQGFGGFGLSGFVAVEGSPQPLNCGSSQREALLKASAMGHSAATVTASPPSRCSCMAFSILRLLLGEFGVHG